jgi:4-amino-4-deoxy-L-arabinose transferase-like glycosyltransferase
VSALDAEAQARSAGREGLWIAALALVPQLFFLDAAVSLDGPVFLAVAKQILADPFDPFGFEMLWDPSSAQAAAFNRNPPLVSYYLAAWMALGASSERALHAALLPFPLIAALSFHAIARRLAGPRAAPGLAAWLCACPAFVVLASAFLLDLPVLALGLVAVLALLRGCEPGRARWQWLAGVGAGLAGLAKYVGLATAPLLALGALLLCSERRALLRVLLPPALLWGAWGVFTQLRYGAPHLFGSADVVVAARLSNSFPNQWVSLLIYWGACLGFPIALWLRALAGRMRSAELAIACLLAATAAVWFVLPGGEPPRRIPLDAQLLVLGSVAAAGGAFGFVAAQAGFRRRDPVDRWLALWLAGQTAFSALVNWHVNAADALLAAPPLLLLIARVHAQVLSARAFGIVTCLLLPLSLALETAEAQQADVYREAARAIGQELRGQPGQRWFVGQWGLQHYLEARDFRPVPPTQLGQASLAVGDWVVSARNVSQLEVARNLARYEIRGVFAYPVESSWPFRTENGDAGAGFYSHHTGYLPFAFSTVPLDEVRLGRVISIHR